MLVKHMLVGYTAYMYILWPPFILNKKNKILTSFVIKSAHVADTSALNKQEIR